ncbi:MAG: hypothetical protein HUJ13_09460 [Hydrogenovibrio crunogenus]|nr:hypothetical protein [Hydrogenovibrio crunogenus]
MDTIITDHTPKNLEEKFENRFLYQTGDYSLMCEETKIPWLQIIPNRALDEAYVATLYGEIYRLAEYLKEKGLGPHYNVAKIGNKLPYYHIHLVFRKTDDEAWPEPIWGKDLQPDLTQKDQFHSLLSGFYG